MKYTGKGSPYVRPLPLQLLVILEGTEFYIVLEWDELQQAEELVCGIA